MATSVEFIEYVCDQISGIGEIRYRKMFGEYMAYVDDRPIFLVCDDTVYVKKIDELSELMKDAEVGSPYEGAKERYILNIDNSELSREVALILKDITPIPKKKKKKKIEYTL